MDQRLGGTRAATPGGRGGVARRPWLAGAVRTVVADEAELMHVAVAALLAREPGYTLVASAGSVGDAAQVIRRVRPDLLICDVDIAGESGIDLCRRVRHARPATVTGL